LFPGDFDFNNALAIFFAIADPEVAQLLPLVVCVLDHEPWPRHKVDSLQSQSRPHVILADSFDRAACYQWLQALCLHREDMSPIERDSRWFQPGTHVAVDIADSDRDIGVSPLKFFFEQRDNVIGQIARSIMRHHVGRLAAEIK